MPRSSPPFRQVAALCATLLCALALQACFKVPYTGRKHVVLISFDDEVKLGADAYKESLAGARLLTSGKQADTVSRIGKELARTTPEQFRKLKWEFKLVDAPDINAFCLPGGKVAVYSGILPIMSTEAGLAAVVGHEIGHAVARHGAERISGGMLLQLGLSIADVSLGNSEMHDQLMAMMGLGATVGVVLPFSRAHELEADYLGAVFMAKAGYDPKESVAVWERMTELAGGNELAFFSTHPSNRKRIERLTEDMATFQKLYKKARKKHGVGGKLM